VFKKLVAVSLTIILLASTGCSYYDRIQEDFYVTDIWGDDADFNTLTINGETTFNDQITLSGDGQVWLEFRPDLDFETVRANGAPTWVTRGVFGGFSLPVVGADEILTIDMCISNRWSKPAWTYLQDVGDKPGQPGTYGGSMYIPSEATDEVYEFINGTFSVSGTVGICPLMALEYNNDLYVSCYGDDTVWVYHESVWSKSGDVGNGPSGMAVFEDELYVACFLGDEIWVFDGINWTVDPALGNGGVAGAVGTEPEWMISYDDDLYVSCGGADDDVWIRNAGAWAKDDDVDNQPQIFHEHDGDLYLNCEGDDTIWVRDGGAWAVATNVQTTLGSAPIGLEEYEGNLYSACKGSVWADISHFWNQNSAYDEITADEPMFLQTYNDALYCVCENGDGIWVYEGETAWIHLHCWITDAQLADTDAFRTELEYENITVGTDIVPVTGDAVIIEVLTGVAVANQSYSVHFPLDMTGVETDDNIGIVIDRIASSDEIAGEVVIQHIGVMFKCDKLGEATP